MAAAALGSRGEEREPGGAVAARVPQRKEPAGAFRNLHEASSGEGRKRGERGRGRQRIRRR